MHQYFIKTPWLVKKLFPKYVWNLPNTNNEVYLTFDDGPHPEITPWVLEQLQKYNAKATFFCIGKNVEKYPQTYQQLLDEGHQVGNHTHNHLNGWKTPTPDYISNVRQAAQHIHSNLFRPPYGRIKAKQATRVEEVMPSNTSIIMWDVLSADFDTSITKEQCAANVINNIEVGSIIVFHDSEKAFNHLQYTLPRVLQVIQEKNWDCKGIYL
jgi:peptidoglycan/xylan/chitin deacetylase (PgdA/CDA1 family)